MQELRTLPVAGDLVSARGERWHVRATRETPAVSLVTLEGADAANHGRRTTLLAPFDRIHRLARARPRRRLRHRVIRCALEALASARPRQGLWSATSAEMDILPWQLSPSLAILDGATRLLLADAVGLGKTVQAGLALAELHARGWADRALVLTPPGVRQQWVDELRRRFGLPAATLDPPALVALARTGGAGANPWSRDPIVVSSIDLVKRPEVRAAVERAPFDVLVVDEAHHLTPGSDRHALVSRLASTVPWLILITATPHSGDAAAFRALLRLGHLPAAPQPMQVFRRSHAAVRLAVGRRRHVWRVQPTPAETALLDGVRAYACELCRGPHGGVQGMQLLAGVFARRAASSPWAVGRTLQRRLEALHGPPGGAAAVPQPLPWDETALEDDTGSYLCLAGLHDASDERHRLQGLIALADAAAGAPSKAGRLRRLLERIAEPIVVFSEFADTVEAYGLALADVATVVCLHGGLSLRERGDRLDAFRDGRARVLVTTDVAGEGLNLHATARTVVTLEWPWNPLRLEQRIGRVHRIGQRRRVHAIHLTARDSYEDVVVARLIARAARAAEDLSGSAADAERAVSAHVLELSAATRGDADTARARDTIARPDVDERAGLEADRVQRARRWLALGGAYGDAPLWALPARRDPTARVVALVEVSEYATGGGLRATRLVPICVTLKDVPADRRAWSAACRRVAADPCVAAAAVVNDNGAGPGDGGAAVRARLEAARDARRRLAPVVVQASLFDRRSLGAAERDAATRAAWDAWQAQARARLAPGISAVRTRVVAVLPLPGNTP